MERKMRGQEQAMADAGYVSIACAAEKMRCHVGTVYRLLKEGSLAGTQVGSRRFITLTSIVRYLGVEGARALGLTA